MKYTITFKTPDVLDNVLDSIPDYFEQNDIINEQIKIKELAEKFILYGEYCHISIDTEKMTIELLMK